MPIEILMPALSPTMTEGNIAKWLKKEGDTVAPGEVIAEIETDKATMEVEAVDEGKLGRILIPAGTEGVKVNRPIALLLTEGEDAKTIENYKPANDDVPTAAAPAAEAPKASTAPAPSSAPQPQASKAPAAPVMAAPSARSGERAKASPLAKRIANDVGVDLSSLSGTGPHGRIVRADVEDAAKRGPSSGRVARNPVEFFQIPNTSMRKVIARRLTESKQQVPHFYLTIDCAIDKLLEVRRDLNDSASHTADGKPAYKVSLNDLIIKACGVALRKVPEANASWYDDAIVQYNNVDVAVAVAIEGGLVTPIVRNADQKGIPAISNEMKTLIQRAKENKLKPEEFQGGGFSLSNLGMYGIKSFSAIINPPQACILAVGAGEEKPVVKDGKIEIATKMEATLSVDHRAVDGAVGAEFLSEFKRLIEKPVLLFI